jgi:hypothetical protein
MAKKRKLSDTLVQVGLRLPEGLRRKLDAEAGKHGRSLNREIVRRIEASFDLQEIETIIKRTVQETANFTIAGWLYAQQHGELPPIETSPEEVKTGNDEKA